MKNKSILSLVLFTTLALASQSQLPWPSITNQQKPWTRWWWEGSAVTPEGLDYNLSLYQKAGLGGVEITPIYGIYGFEKQFLPFLSNQWMNALQHTLNQSKKLGLGVDLANGTGWPFGGPYVKDEDASKTIYFKTYQLSGGARLMEPVEYVRKGLVRTANNKSVKTDQVLQPIAANTNLQALALDQIQFPGKLPIVSLMAYGEEGTKLDLTSKITPDGQLNWTAPKGDWNLYALFQGLHGKMVERAAPGGEGYAIDHFSQQAANNYFSNFDKAFKGYDIRYLRAFFNDSYEVDDAAEQANWTPDFLDQFQQKKGYDLRNELPALFGKDNPEKNERVLYDYRSVIDELILGSFTRQWKNWATKQGKLVRNQSHGSPANTLDLYGVVDIPETEGTELLRFKFASSASNVMGKQLTAAESATWLNEHFLSSLGDVKKSVDRYFLGGVNHIVYHGTAYSPKDVPWPGWLFYAAVHFQPTNPQWNHFHALNQYVARVQSFLQRGQSDNDVLLYYPIVDRYSQAGGPMLQHFDGMEKNFENTDFEKLAEKMLEEGYSFDFFSDRQLQQFDVKENKVMTGGKKYQCILLPGNKYIPESSMKKILELAAQGATVLFYKDLPSGVPGWGDFQIRQEEYNRLLTTIKWQQESNETAGFKNANGGIILKSSNISDLLVRVRKEDLGKQGFRFVRRTLDGSDLYFIENNSGKDFDGWLHFASTGRDAALYDPMTGKSGLGKAFKLPGKLEKGVKVYVQVPAGGSLIVKLMDKILAAPAWNYYQKTGVSLQLNQGWSLQFLEGGPQLPASLENVSPGSWTDLPDSSYKRFSGLASYKIRFAKPAASAPFYELNLGTVKETAEVLLNGKSLATLVGPVFKCMIPASLLQKENLLEIKIASLMANRIIDMDRKQQPWKIFYNTNMPARKKENVRNGIFDASAWSALPAGLLGPVLLNACNSLQPQKELNIPKPLFDDPIHRGAADPVVIWNKNTREWWMFYTNRRAANSPDTAGVSWCHGTRIGIAVSPDGVNWNYKDTCDINFRPNPGYTFWAPAVIEDKGLYHMFVTYVPGIFEDWNHPREIIHATSKDLQHWTYVSTLPLANKKVIDPTVFKLPDGTWRMWYNNEMDRKSIYYADSKDLYNWVDKGKAIGARGEGPSIFQFNNNYWMMVDVWKGMEFYYSTDLLNWTLQPNRVLEQPGLLPEDQAIGGHGDVIENNGRLYLYYFTHPGRYKGTTVAPNSLNDRRTLIQLTELKEVNGMLDCNRNQTTIVPLQAPFNKKG